MTTLLTLYRLTLKQNKKTANKRVNKQKTNEIVKATGEIRYTL